MSDFSISLGSCTGNLTAATLQEAAAAAASKTSSPFQSLTITLKASELGTVWSNPMDLAALSFTETVIVCVEQDTGGDVDLQTIHKAFLLAGCQGTSERKDSNMRVLTAKKASATSRPVSAAAIQLKINNAATAVTIDNDNDMIDEDDLLNEESADLAPDMNGVEASKDDCGGREPCADCTCGRADNKKEEEKKDGEKKPIKTSSCGKCGLGDAFRCASCPYLGSPAFKPGEEHLVLELKDDF